MVKNCELLEMMLHTGYELGKLSRARLAISRSKGIHGPHLSGWVYDELNTVDDNIIQGLGERWHVYPIGGKPRRSPAIHIAYTG
jgi:hypothetical protein